MKKFAFLPLAALLMLASCKSDDPTPRPEVPTDPVATVPSQADDVTLNAPEQYPDYELDGSLYRFTYANGQQISYTLTTDATQGNVARVRKIAGASEVIIPSVVNTQSASTGEPLQYKVVCLDLFLDTAEGVVSLTLPKTAVAGYDNSALSEVNGAWFRRQLEMLPDLEKIELESGFPKFCSIDGAIYSADYKTLVGVPRAAKGVFTIAEDTQVVAEHAFYYCNSITAITFPAGVTEIQAGAVTFNDMLVLINMMPETAPKTAEDAFGEMARTGLLRIPSGSYDSYFPEKPEIVEPTPPTEPAYDAPDEEWEQYDILLYEYETAKAEYDAEMAEYQNPAGFRDFTNVEQVNF
ncbi:MAG: leucine-rich repeat domain-containing protein [Muribaculaceae bacterium]|nr:leucine-rich repeat domain-containing protein [Muribaculaceae bacterium]